ncbi:MAG: DUF2924 domain-containing protein [Hyphomicrobiales bacterium]
MLSKPRSRLTLNDLEYLSREQLAWLWERTYGCLPPKGVRRGLLERSAAFEIQARSQTRTVKAVKARLRALQGEQQDGSMAHEHHSCSADTIAPGANTCPYIGTEAKPPPRRRSSGARTLSPGTRLMREWNGRTYVVDVVEGGFVLDGRKYTSLSAVAIYITGTHWSGPRFFGL